MPELLLELLSEEIPARMQARAAEDLKRLVCDGLRKAGLTFDKAEAFVTPRRLALVVDGIPEKLEAKSEEKRGPRTDAPEKAIEGFKGSLPEGAKIEKRETEKGEFYFALVEKKGQATEEVLPHVLDKAISTLPWAKSMRWSDSKYVFVRPLRNVLAVFNGSPLGWRMGLGSSRDDELPHWTNDDAPAWTDDNALAWGSRRMFPPGTKLPDFVNVLDFCAITTGHRFLSPGEITVKDFADYKAKLQKAHVVLDAAERRAMIEAGARELAKKEGLELKDDPGLLDEVTGLVEWPVVLMGSIDKAFMELPPEVLTTVMRHHQKYFALLDKKGGLAPRFIVVANTEASDCGKAIIAGNERVLSARLADAKFFWDQDRKRTLESRVDGLKDRVFHAKLGSVLDKVERVAVLAGALAEPCGADAGDAKRAARLAKADLSTEMVGELPELQGVMGSYYALADGEKPEVAAAVAEHYSPQGPNDSCPSAPLSVAVALADKIDSLVGFWAIDEKPTGSKDPYALRRAALGVIRLILENELRMGLITVIKNAHAFLEDPIDKGTVRVSTFEDHTGEVTVSPKTVTEGGSSFELKESHKISSADDVSDSLLSFFADRLKVHLRGKDVPYDHIDAVFALGGEDDLVRLLARVDALGQFLKTADGGNLLTAYKRAANIVRIEEKNDGKRHDGKVDEKLLELKQEKSLHKELKSTAAPIAQALKDEDFHAAMGLLAGLRKPVDVFFDHVTVNVDEAPLRENRLKLLSNISATMNRVADFSKIEGGER